MSHFTTLPLEHALDAQIQRNQVVIDANRRYLDPNDPTPYEVQAGWAILHQMEADHWWAGFRSYPAGNGLWSRWHDEGYLAAAECAAQLRAEQEERYDAETAWMV